MAGRVLRRAPFLRRAETPERRDVDASLGGFPRGHLRRRPFVLFSRLEIWIHPGLFLSASTLVFILAYVFRLDEAAHKLDGKYHDAQRSRLGGRSRRRPEPPAARPAWPDYLSSRGIQAKIGRLLHAEQEYEGRPRGYRPPADGRALQSLADDQPDVQRDDPPADEGRRIEGARDGRAISPGSECLRRRRSPSSSDCPRTKSI